VADWLPATAVPTTGAPGATAGVTLVDRGDSALGPELFFATTENVYAVPLISPVTVVPVVGPSIGETVAVLLPAAYDRIS
jgi:hypothetical protein